MWLYFAGWMDPAAIAQHFGFALGAKVYDFAVLEASGIAGGLLLTKVLDSLQSQGVYLIFVKDLNDKTMRTLTVGLLRFNPFFPGAPMPFVGMEHAFAAAMEHNAFEEGQDRNRLHPALKGEVFSLDSLCSGFTGTQLLANVLLQREGQRQEGQEQALVEGALPLPRRENRAWRQCF